MLTDSRKSLFALLLLSVGVGCERQSATTTLPVVQASPQVLSSSKAVTRTTYDDCTGGASPDPQPTNTVGYAQFERSRTYSGTKAGISRPRRDADCTVPSPIPIIFDETDNEKQIGPALAASSYLAGERITLKVKMSDGSTPIDPVWNLGSAIKNYEFPQPFIGSVITNEVQMPMGKVDALTATDLDASTVSFYYTSAASDAVSVTVANNGGQSQTAVITIKAPQPSAFSSVTPRSIDQYNHVVYINGARTLRPGYYLDGETDALATDAQRLADGAYPGITWTFAVTGDGATGNNFIFMTQLLQQCQDTSTFSMHTPEIFEHYYAQPALDTTAPYGVPSQRSAANTTYVANDSPGTDTQNNEHRIKAFRLTDNFTDFFMFQSSKSNSIPVTLATMAWKMSVGAVQPPAAPTAVVPNDLVLVPAQTQKPAAQVAMTSSTLPQWTTVLGVNEYPKSTARCTP